MHVYILNRIIKGIISTVLFLSFLKAYATDIPEAGVVRRTQSTKVYTVFEPNTTVRRLVLLQQITTFYNTEKGLHVHLAILSSVHKAGEPSLSRYITMDHAFNNGDQIERAMREAEIKIDDLRVAIGFDEEMSADLKYVELNEKFKKPVFLQKQGAAKAKLSTLDFEQFKVQILRPIASRIPSDSGVSNTIFSMGWRREMYTTVARDPRGLPLKIRMGDYHYAFSGMGLSDIRNMKPANVENKRYMISVPGEFDIPEHTRNRSEFKVLKHGFGLEFNLSAGYFDLVSAYLHDDIAAGYQLFIKACNKIY